MIQERIGYMSEQMHMTKQGEKNATGIYGFKSNIGCSYCIL